MDLTRAAQGQRCGPRGRGRSHRQGWHRPTGQCRRLHGIQFLADLQHVHQVAPSPEFQLSAPLSFATRTVAIANSGPWAIGRTNDAMAKLGHEWDIAPFPKGKVVANYSERAGHGDPRGSKVEGRGLGTSGSRRWTPSEQIAWIDNGMGVPVSGNNQVYVKNPANRKVVVDEEFSQPVRVPGDEAHGTYYAGYFAEFRAIMMPALDPVWLGRTTAQAAMRRSGQTREADQDRRGLATRLGRATSRMARVTAMSAALWVNRHRSLVLTLAAGRGKGRDCEQHDDQTSADWGWLDE